MPTVLHHAKSTVMPIGISAFLEIQLLVLVGNPTDTNLVYFNYI